jgi:hypothetical protein
VAEQIRTRVPKDFVEAEHDLVEVAVAEPLDRVHLPVWQRRRERDGVGMSGRILSDALLQHAERQGAQYGVALVRGWVGVAAGVGGRHFAARRPVADLSDGRVELDVQALGE